MEASAGSSGGGSAGAGGQAGGSGGETALPNQIGGSAGEGGGAAGSSGASGAGGGETTEPGDAGPDAAAPDAATTDAGDANPLGCAPADRADCAVLLAALAHRYSFNGSGTGVTDSAGTAHGSVQNGQLTGTGELALDGTDQFVDLPNGIVSSLQSATFEAWVNWAGGAQWQRIFDFGSSNQPEGTPGGGDTYLFLTPRATGNTVRVTFLSDQSGNEIEVNSASQLPAGSDHHVAVVVDEQAQSLSLYIDGAPAGSGAFANHLSELSDVNNWLGLSQFNSDPLFEGSLLEFRIYSAALTPQQISLSFGLGPEAALTQ